MSIKKILLVEGPDDKHTVEQLCNRRGLPRFDEVKPYEGVEQLLESLPTRLKLSQPGEIVGVVIDADTNLAARWQSIRNRLIESGYSGLPEVPDPTGTILTPPTDSLLPPVGVWIMPGNRTDGKLEDFLRFLVPNDSHLFEYVESSVASIPQSERLFTRNDEIKAIIHTWLAWQEEPGLPFGTAIRAEFFNHRVPEVDVFVSWLTRLFFQENV